MANEVRIVITAKDQASAVMEKTKGNAGALGKALSDVGKIAGGFLAAQVISKGFSSFANGVTGSIRNASDLSESINAVTQIFDDSADRILQWGQQNATSFGLSQRAFNEMATPLGAMLKNAGLEDFADQTINLTKRASDMASVFNTDVGEALAAIQAAIRGESDPIERYGVSLRAADVEARALADTGKTTAKALTQQELTAARLALIFDQTADVEGDFANTSDGLANSQRIAAAKTEELSAKLGQKLLPISLAVTRVKLKLVEALADKLLPAMDRVSAFVGGQVVPRLKDLSEKYGPPVEAFIGEALPKAVEVLRSVLEDKLVPAAKKVGDYFVTNILPILEDVAAFIKDKWAPNFVEGLRVIGRAFDEVKPYIEDLVNFLASRKEVMIAIAAAIGLAIAVALGPIPIAIAGVIAAIGYLSKHWDELKAKADEVFSAVSQAVHDALGDDFIEAVSSAFESISDIVSTVLPYVVEYVQGQIETLKSIFGALAGAVSDHWGAIRAVLQWVAEDILARLKGLGQAITGVVEIVAGVVATISALIHGDWSAAWDGLVQVVEGVLDLLEGAFQTMLGNLPNLFISAAGKASDAASDFAKSVFNAIVNWFEGLPDKLYDAGVDAVQGLIDGAKSLLGEVDNVAADVANRLTFGITGALGIHSPSTVMRDYGQDAVQGFINGVASQAKAVNDVVVSSIFEPVRAAVEQAQALATVGVGIGQVPTRNGLTPAEAAQYLLSGVGGVGQPGLAGVAKAIYDSTGKLLGSFEEMQAFLGTSLPGVAASIRDQVVATANLGQVYDNYVKAGFSAWTAAVAAAMAVIANALDKVTYAITDAGEIFGSNGTFIPNPTRAQRAAAEAGVNPGEVHDAFNGIQHFAKGGTVPGPMGRAQLAVVHGGETVIPAGGKAVQPVIYQVHFHGSVINGEEEIARVVRKVAQNGGFAGLFATA